MAAKYKFGQDHNTPENLVMSTLSLEVPLDSVTQDMSHVNKDSTSITIFLFMEAIQLLLAETHKYYSQYSRHI